MRVSVTEAKARLSALIDRAVAGEEIVITRHGRPVAKLVGADALREPRKLGLLKGRVRISPDFDRPLPADLLDAFEGRA